MPTYFYEYLIVEPQIYTAVERVYQSKPLRPVEKAFLPEAIDPGTAAAQD